MKSAGALHSGRCCLMTAAIAVTALTLSAYTFALAQTESIDEPSASAVWRTAAVASVPAPPVGSSNATAPPGAATTANVVVTPPDKTANAGGSSAPAPTV